MYRFTVHCTYRLVMTRVDRASLHCVLESKELSSWVEQLSCTGLPFPGSDIPRVLGRDGTEPQVSAAIPKGRHSEEVGLGELGLATPFGIADRNRATWLIGRCVSMALSQTSAYSAWPRLWD